MNSPFIVRSMIGIYDILLYIFTQTYHAVI